MVNRMVLNETSYFGRNSRERIIDEINSRNYQRLYEKKLRIILEK